MIGRLCKIILCPDQKVAREKRLAASKQPHPVLGAGQHLTDTLTNIRLCGAHFFWCQRSELAGLIQDSKNDIKKTVKTGSNVMPLTTRKSDNDRTKKVPSNEKAFHCLEAIMKWLKQQEECDTVQSLPLKRVQYLAAEKRGSALKQKKIFEFFS
ncbi:hypothetical protein AVEN_162881-1 [Araneus ventricosus]|uniref:Uncharacterized protein n=1 Tax=Araneus ventricosus TaxID=182803 RepID=A0A4Y2N6S1_ARAVE|nr:hypothetical protein AVEN_162881-1 [Araneus ventricosus]